MILYIHVLSFLYIFIFINFVVEKFVSNDNLPHLLFYGPPGTGKTSSILAIAKQIYSDKQRRSMVLEV